MEPITEQQILYDLAYLTARIGVLRATLDMLRGNPHKPNFCRRLRVSLDEQRRLWNERFTMLKNLEGGSL